MYIQYCRKYLSVKMYKNLKTAKLSLKVTGSSLKKNSFLIEEQFRFINVELHYNHN